MSKDCDDFAMDERNVRERRPSRGGRFSDDYHNRDRGGDRGGDRGVDRIEREPSSGLVADASGKKKRRYKRFSDRRRCRFCRENMGKIDYKDIMTLKKLCTSQGKLYSRKRSGNCSYHQRAAKTAIKRARFLALMPYMGSI
ncbi:MAG: 30S ribosomal protein S18 [Planctomycetota bacterium]